MSTKKKPNSPFTKRNRRPFNPSPTKSRLFMGVALAQQQNVKLAEAFDAEMVGVRKQIEDVQIQLARVIVRSMVTEQILKEKLGLTNEDIDQAVQIVAPNPTSPASEEETASVAGSSTETCNSPQDSVSEQSQESSATKCDDSVSILAGQSCAHILDTVLSAEPVAEPVSS